MNFLAHLYLVRDQPDYMLGGLLGDFVRGRLALRAYPQPIKEGIRLHRQIDRFTDSHKEVKALRRVFNRPFRRYAGIIIDMAFDHELALNWRDFSIEPLEDFDVRVRGILSDRSEYVHPDLDRFMTYADRRGLFSNYRDEQEILRSLTGIGRRLRRANPLDRVDEIWPQVKLECRAGFERFFPQLQSEVELWLKRTSTTTGS